MNKPKLLHERVFEKDFKLNNGKIITIKLSEDFEEISFWENSKQHRPGDEVFEFRYLEDNFSGIEKYLLKRMYIPYIQCGLGTEAVKLFKEYTNALIITRTPYTGPLDDGSHLTGDAIIFIDKMQKLGLIEKWHKGCENEL